MKTLHHLFLLILTAAAALSTSAARAIIYPVSNLNDSGPGSLRAGIIAANANPDISGIAFDPLTGTLELLSALPILNTPMTITGPALPSRVKISVIARTAGSQYPAFWVQSTVRIESLELLRDTTSASTAGIANFGALTLVNCTLRGFGDSGLKNYGTAQVIGSTFVGCVSTYGGAIYGNGPLTVENSTFSENFSFRDGGAIYQQGSAAVSLDSVTMLGNRCGYEGFYPYSVGPQICAPGTITLRNSLVLGQAVSMDGEISATFTPDHCQHDFFVRYPTGYAFYNQITALQDNGGPTPTHLPLSENPALNAGATTLITDQRGGARPNRGVPDIGAVERTEPHEQQVVTTTVDEDNGNADPSFGTGTSLREAMLYTTAPCFYCNSYIARISFDPSVFATRKTINLAGTALPPITDELRITGPAAGVIISGQAQSRLFTVVNGDGKGFPVQFYNLHLRNGAAPGQDGGAILVENEPPPLYIKQFYGLEMTGCTISNCTAARGGAIAVKLAEHTGRDVLLRDCTFSGNTAEEGGALYVTLIAPGGSDKTELALSNCTLTGNTTTTSARGALHVVTGHVVLESCTIVQNTGMGVIANSGSRVDVANSILALHGGQDAGFNGATNPFVSGSHNFFGGGNAQVAFVGTGDYPGAGDPLLAPLAENGGQVPTRLPLTGSGAIDTGAAGPDRDARGAIRPRGPADDIGAVETPSIPAGALTLSPAPAFTNDVLTAQTSGITNTEGSAMTFTYVWKKNGAVIAGATAASLNLAAAGAGDRGDVIRTEVTATNEDRSAVLSAQTTVQNSAPVLAPATFTFTRGTAITSAQLTATDADGNAITYAIASGTLPGGISLAANGALIGTPTAHTTALGITVTASASDGVLAGTAALTIRVVEMPSLIVTSLGELATPYDGQTTLREAIAFANSNADTSAITFAAGLTGTLNLQGALPVLTTNLSITGPDAATLSVRRFLGGDYRLFEIAGGATVSLTGLTVSGGSAGDGAGVLNAGALTLTECALRDHAAGGSGGALYNADGGSAALLRCTVSGCSAGTGGGVCSGNASLSLENCTISGNTASVRGGGVHALAATIVNATITANTAPTGGGLSTSSPGANLVQVRDTILAGNTGGDCTITGTAVRSNGWNLAGNGNGIAAFTASGDTTGATSASILLGPLQNNGGPTLTHELLTLSPAINHGGSPLLTDQRGVARPFSGVPDIGAVERDSLNTSSLVTTTVDENDGNSDPAFGTGTSLREAIAFANSDPGASVITFDPAVFAVRRTITLVSQLPSLTTPIQITAPAAGLVLEGSSARRIMQISSNAAVTFTNLTFAHGAAPSPGGGALHIIASTQPVTLVGCTFEGNTGLNGGAIYAQAGFTGGTVTLRQCTFSGNAATGEAGALAITQGRVLIESCTITNAAKGVFAFGTAQVTVSNTIIAGHTGDDVKWGGSANPFQSGGHNLIGTGNAAGVFTAAGDLTGVTAPQLGALALNGGPAPTLLPLPGSPAIDAGETALGADQRGLLRPQGSAPDIGAVETTGAPITPLVTTLEDSANSYDGLTSLREAIIFANGNADTTAITFAPGLTGTINLLSALPSLTTNLSITGPGAAALTVQRAVSQNFRIFAIAAGASVSLNGLAIAHGKMSAPGAGISNAGTLTITACRLSENAASGSHGGAISTTGTLLLEDSEISGNTAGQWGGGLYRPAGSGATTIRRCTLSGNTATYGGGLYAVECALTLESSTLSGNTAQQGAGAVFAALTPGAALTLAHCTITANTSSSAGGGMSVYTGQASRLQMTHCILAGNSPDDCDSYFATAAQSNGWNLIGTGYGSASFNAAGDQTGLTSAALLLGPLQANGGLTFTHLPLAGSPALDAANAARGTVPSTDQRGLPRIVRARIDIGACEAATAPGYETWIWQQLPAAATAAQHAPAADFDHDGQTNQDEWLALTRPHDSTSVFTPALNLTGPSAYIFFPSVVGRRYQLRQSSDLTTWTAAPGQPVMEGNGSVLAFAIPADTARAFYQVIPSLP